TGFTSKHAGAMVSHRNRHHFSRTFTSTSSSPVWGSLFWHGAGHAQLLRRFSSVSERTPSISTALRTKDFKNYAQTILSCGKASSFWRAPASKNYISAAQTPKTTVCDDSNFLGTRRKKQLITSASIHRVGRVSLWSALGTEWTTSVSV